MNKLIRKQKLTIIVIIIISIISYGGWYLEGFYDDFVEKSRRSYFLNVISSYELLMDAHYDEFGYYSLKFIPEDKLTDMGDNEVLIYAKSHSDLNILNIKENFNPFVKRDNYRLILRIDSEKQGREYWVLEKSKTPHQLLVK